MFTTTGAGYHPLPGLGPPTHPKFRCTTDAPPRAPEPQISETQAAPTSPPPRLREQEKTLSAKEVVENPRTRSVSRSDSDKRSHPKTLRGREVVL